MTMKPLLVAVSESRHFVPSPFSVNLSIESAASVLQPSQEIANRLSSLLTLPIPQREKALPAIEDAYLALLRTRYGKEGRKAEFERLISLPMLILGIACEPEAMTWEIWGINVLLKLAANQGREARLVGRVPPPLFPVQVAVEQDAEPVPF